MFSGKVTDLSFLSSVILAFVAMIMASCSVYIFNDIADRERDLNHPKKKNRPIASGAITPRIASLLGVCLLGGSLAIGLILNKMTVVLILVYLVLQVAYNLKFKSIPVLDVFIIATGFVLRAVIGAAAIQVAISGWFLFCTAALALMLGFAKRRNEFLLQNSKAGESRESLAHYSQRSLDVLVSLFAGFAALCYAIYTIESSTAKSHPSIIITCPFVIYGIARYLLLVFNVDEGGEPADLLFGDIHIITSVVFFIFSAALAMSGTIHLRFLEP